MRLPGLDDEPDGVPGIPGLHDRAPLRQQIIVGVAKKHSRIPGLHDRAPLRRACRAQTVHGSGRVFPVFMTGLH
ncbi:hypothetical protein HMPREF0682_2499 [Propionibacterium acidifaciens F0233]|uniref:Uncharacterized protein n=1 Tax=Propionibacterium acidifaciens F0233 TaxID=553198 RepID=U2Q2H3_9ACTN|nr:hypothetical protein HMPREF0682_2499 [Propionibacterium acidifaciens F0233]